MKSTPASLLERLRRPSERDWERFVNLYTPLLSLWARRLGLANQEAADLVQDVFTILVQKLPKFRYDPARRFRGWLWTVTVNSFRERHRRRAIPAFPVGADTLAQMSTPDHAEIVAEEEYRQYVTRRALDLMRAEFQPPTWKAFWGCVVEERSAQDMAQELGLTENAVYLAKGRVLRRLRLELDGLLD